ncbi:hypothetical protein TNCT_734901 [Trichonephila clavata]|uniref:Uncharacterized protein n=1 Tax=Trichonephila clavata TaxID=2740835 RepID=A0A8X6LIP3_TRICU|nr:hypothetical protein TNCT_734901 [Trichonephila clavata]
MVYVVCKRYSEQHFGTSCKQNCQNLKDIHKSKYWLLLKLLTEVRLLCFELCLKEDFDSYYLIYLVLDDETDGL